MIKLSAKQKNWLIIAIALLVVFVVFTLEVIFVDADGQVGFSRLNQSVWRHFGQSKIWEEITNWFGYLLIAAVFGLVVWQIAQWVRRKSLLKVDRNLWLFDVICACLVVVYIFFEIVVVNCRPILDGSVAKASYPSSHAMLFATILPLLIYQVWHYLKNKSLRITLTVLLSMLLVISVVGRLLSGVHWFTDILAGLIMAGCLDCFYMVFVVKTNDEVFLGGGSITTF